MTEKFTAFDAAQVLENDEMIVVFMNEALKTGDAAHIAHALGVAARAKRMTKIAQDSGLNREQLYRSLSEQGNPTLRNLLSVIQAIGLQLAVQPRQAIAT